MKVDVTQEAVVVETPSLPERRRHVTLQRLVERQLVVMAIIVGLVALPGIVLVWWLVPPVYEASADIRLFASRPHVIGGQSSGDATVAYEKFLNTQVSLITGANVLSQVVRDPAIKAMPAVAGMNDPLEFLKRIIEVEARPNSELITVTCALASREDAKLIIERTVSAYMEYALDQEADSGGERLRVLSAERDARQQDLDNQLRRIAELQQAIGAPAVDSAIAGLETTAYQGPLARAEEEIADHQSNVALLEEQAAAIARLQEQHKVQPAKPIFDMGIEDKVNADPRVAAIRTEYAKADGAYALAAHRFAAGSSQLEAERGKVAPLKAKLLETEERVRGNVLAAAAAQTTREISTARAALRGAAARKDEFGKMIQTRRTEAVAAASALAELDELRIRADETRAVLRAVRDEITSISVDSNAPARVKLAGEASVPFIPDGGKRLQLLFMVVIGALTAGLGAGTLCELNDHTVRTIEDVASICDKPILCAVPDFSDSAPSLSAMTLVQEKPSTVAAHEIRKIVPYLTASALRDGVRSCVMVSAERHDGRTFLACNLAIALAQANRRVLLVETSPQAKAEGALGLDRDAGISDILCSQSSFPDCVRHTPIANLFFIGIGTRSDMISAKIASRDMMQLLRHAEQCFDHVIIDTPCFTDMADAGVLAQLANATIAVVRLDSSNVQAVHSMIQMLNRCRVGVLGVAVNAWRRRDAFEFIRGRLRAGVLKLQRAAPVSAYAAAEPYSGTGQVERDRD